MSSSEVKSEDKPRDGTTDSALQADDCLIKDKCIENLKETNGTMENKSADNEPEVHVDEAETDTVPIEQKTIELPEKQPGTHMDEKAEEPKSADEVKKSPHGQNPVDHLEKSPQKNHTEKIPTASVVSEFVDTQKAADSGKGKKENATTEKDDQPLEQKPTDECDQKNDKDKTSTVQGGLPKWMVQDANAPPSPSPEVDGHKEKQQPSTSPLKVRGRGRGRRPAAEKTALKEKIAQSAMEETASQRPRRSTRSRIDYANPDAVTVLAEVDDEEPSGTTKRQKGARGSKPGLDKGLKRKTIGTSEDEVRGEEDEDDLDYGAKKKKKRVGAGSPSKRGRPAGSKSKTMTKAKNVGRPKRGRNNEKESEDDDAEVVYDDRVSEKERTTDDEFEETKPSQNKVKNSVQAKPPAKKRGRPPGRRQGQQPSIDSGKTAKSETDEAKGDEESGHNQQTINVEA